MNCAVKKAFSLIELIVVIAIIGMVSAIAVPAYRDYKVRANASAITSNLDYYAHAPIKEKYGLSGVLPTNTTEYAAAINSQDEFIPFSSFGVENIQNILLINASGQNNQPSGGLCNSSIILYGGIEPGAGTVCDINVYLYDEDNTGLLQQRCYVDVVNNPQCEGIFPGCIDDTGTLRQNFENYLNSGCI